MFVFGGFEPILLKKSLRARSQGRSCHHSPASSRWGRRPLALPAPPWGRRSSRAPFAGNRHDGLGRPDHDGPPPAHLRSFSSPRKCISRGASAGRMTLRGGRPPSLLADRRGQGYSSRVPEQRLERRRDVRRGFREARFAKWPTKASSTTITW